MKRVLKPRELFKIGNYLALVDLAIKYPGPPRFPACTQIIVYTILNRCGIREYPNNLLAYSVKKYTYYMHSSRPLNLTSSS